MQALFELANLTMHVPESFITTKRRAQDVVSSITAFDELAAKKIMAGGFVSIFLDLIDSDDDVMQLLKSIDIRLSMLRSSSNNYTVVLPQWLEFYYPATTCLQTYEDDITRISSAVHKLYLYVNAKTEKLSPFIVQERLDAFKAVCANNVCRDVTEALLSGLTGGASPIFPCDLSTVLYQGVPGGAMQVMAYMAKGWRDMVTPYNGYLLSYTAASMLVLSAYDSAVSSDQNNWRLLQSNYNGQLKLAIKKMKYMDSLMQD